MKGVVIKMIARSRLVLAAILCGLTYQSCLADGGPYRLGPEERLSIKVWDMRNGEAFQWTALNDEFSIGADGNVILPLIGPIHAAGMSVAELASTVGESLKRKIGLSTKPEAAVQIIRYRPFYVVGAVQRPGKFEFQPNLTVLQAISLAEGIYRDNSSLVYNFARDNISARGEIRSLSRERTALLAKQARLTAEISGADVIPFPEEFSSNKLDPYFERIKREELMLFNGRRESVNAQLSAIAQSKSVLNSQLMALSTKEATLSRQVELTRSDLALVTGLLNKGMALAPRKLAAEQSLATFESSQLDVQLAKLKAQQDLSQAERDEIDVRTKFKTGSLAEAAEIRSKIAIIDEKIAASTKLESTSDDLLRKNTSSTQINGGMVFSIVRPGISKEIPASASTSLEPGDVLSVSKAEDQPIYRLKTENLQSESNISIVVKPN